VWQLVKLHYTKIIGSLSEDDLVKWANNLVADHKIKNLKDKEMSDGHFLLQVLSSIEPRAIDWDIVKKGEAEEDKENNAKYIVSIVRKLGGVVFCVWEDLVKVDYKQTFILFATIYELDQQIKSGAAA
jgi:plastin-1